MHSLSFLYTDRNLQLFFLDWQHAGSIDQGYDNHFSLVLNDTFPAHRTILSIHHLYINPDLRNVTQVASQSHACIAFSHTESNPAREALHIRSRMAGHLPKRPYLPINRIGRQWWARGRCVAGDKIASVTLCIDAISSCSSVISNAVPPGTLGQPILTSKKRKL